MTVILRTMFFSVGMINVSYIRDPSHSQKHIAVKSNFLLGGNMTLYITLIPLIDLNIKNHWQITS